MYRNDGETGDKVDGLLPDTFGFGVRRLGASLRVEPDWYDGADGVVASPRVVVDIDLVVSKNRLHSAYPRDSRFGKN